MIPSSCALSTPAATNAATTLPADVPSARGKV